MLEPDMTLHRGSPVPPAGRATLAFPDRSVRGLARRPDTALHPGAWLPADRSGFRPFRGRWCARSTPQPDGTLHIRAQPLTDGRGTLTFPDRRNHRNRSAGRGAGARIPLGQAAGRLGRQWDGGRAGHGA